METAPSPATAALEEDATKVSSTSWITVAGAVIKRWIGTFIRTLLLFLVVGGVVGTISAYIAADGWAMRSATLAMVLLISAAAGVFLGIHQAMASASVEALKRLGVCRQVSGALCHMVARRGDASGSAVVSLADAERCLKDCLRHFDPELPRRRWLTRVILRPVHRRVVEMIETVTLAELRGDSGEVTVSRVQDHLETRLESAAADSLIGPGKRLVRICLILLAVGAPALALAARLASAPPSEPAVEPSVEPSVPTPSLPPESTALEA